MTRTYPEPEPFAGEWLVEPTTIYIAPQRLKDRRESAIHIKVLDEGSLPVVGARVDLLTDRGAFADVRPYPRHVASMTNEEGIVTASLTTQTPEVTPGYATITATIHRFAGADLVLRASINVVGSAAGNGVTITGFPSIVAAGEPVTIGVSVQDAVGQPVCDGTPISLVTTSGGTLSPSRVLTFGGKATAYLITSSQHVGTYTVIATVEDSEQAPISVQIRVAAGRPGSNWGGRPEQAFDVAVAESIARKRGLLAIVFTDIVDSTPLVLRLGDPEYLLLLDQHDRVIEELVSRHGGRIANTTGDGFFLAFDSAVEAADACFEMMESIRNLQISVRAGIHIGEPLPTGKTNYIGVSANETARLMSKVEPGRIVISDAAKRVLSGTPRFVYRSLGFVDLKGFDEQNEAFEIWRTE